MTRRILAPFAALAVSAFAFAGQAAADDWSRPRAWRECKTGPPITKRSLTRDSQASKPGSN